MVLSNAEKKRISRAKKPAKYHAQEREKSRKRMAIYRAKNRAQKRADQLKSLLSERDREEIEAHVAKQKQYLLSDWFNHHNLRFDPKMINKTSVLNSFMTKIELNKIELQVAEFEISIIEEKDDHFNELLNGFGLGGDGEKLAEGRNEINRCSTQAFRSTSNHRLREDNEISHFIETVITSSVCEAEKGQEGLAMDKGESTINSNSTQIFRDGRAAPEILGVVREEYIDMGASSTNYSANMQQCDDGRDVPENLRVVTEEFTDMGASSSNHSANMQQLGSGRDLSAYLCDVEEESANTGGSVVARMHAFGDGIDEVVSAEKDDGLLRMDMQDVTGDNRHQQFGGDRDAPEYLGDAKEESANPAVSVVAGMHPFVDGINEVVSAEKDDGLLRMDMQDFTVDNGHLRIDDQFFTADAYLW
mmetsp:Transcript_42207/g.89761  ORF Transcript_42207/g.89761 Transcript_42207/m.89761 type:complete len:418 (-) Transcript_42207:291-1544(-)